MGSLFGKRAKSKSVSTQQSASGNYAYEDLKAALSPSLSTVNQSTSMLSALLGGSGGEAQKQALTDFSNSAGMQFLQERGNDQISSNMATRGLLNSGSALKSLLRYGQDLGKTYLGQYTDLLTKNAGLGLGAASAIGGTGGWSTGSGTSTSTSKGPKKGLLDYAGDAAAAYAAAGSDRRLKDDVTLVGYLEDGLGVYEWTYKPDMGMPEGRFRGVMADEVKELRPQAYIEDFKDGYAGVDYARL